MDAITTPQPSDNPLSHFADILRAEFCKLRSVRSTFWTLFAAVVFNVGLAALLAIFLPGALSAHEKATIDSTRLSLGGLHLSQIAIGVLGVLVITSEYGTGMIRATLSAVPQRRLMLVAKTIVFAAAALIVGILASFAAYLVFQALVSGGSLRTSIGDPGVLRAVTGAGLYLAVLGLFGLGLGAIIRSSAGAVAALFGLLFVPPLIMMLLPHSWQETIGPYLPMQAGTAIYIVQHDPGSLGAWSGFGVFCLYAAAALVTGFALINHRDA
jgi:ABC-2 type transport system permease protein